MEFNAGTAALASRARLAVVASWGLIAMTASMLSLELAEAGGIIDPLFPSEGLALAYLAVGVGYTLAFIISVVLVAMWIYRAHANLRETGMDGLEFSPGWAVGWYFIPIANLFKPYQAMRELWNATMSQADHFAAEAPPDVKFWWGCWIVGHILSNVANRFALSETSGGMQVGALIGAASSVAIIACAWQLMKLIRDITSTQRNGFGAAEVFA